MVSHVTPSSGEHSYVKTILQGDGGTVAQTREVPKGSELGNIIREVMPGAPEMRPMNTPTVIGRIDGQEIRLLVGAAVHE